MLLISMWSFWLCSSGVVYLIINGTRTQPFSVWNQAMEMKKVMPMIMVMKRNSEDSRERGEGGGGGETFPLAGVPSSCQMKDFYHACHYYEPISCTKIANKRGDIVPKRMWQGNIELREVLCPAVLVKTRFCGGCSVSRAHKTFLRSILFCICLPKQSHNAIRHNTDPVPRGTWKWPMTTRWPTIQKYSLYRP